LLTDWKLIALKGDDVIGNMCWIIIVDLLNIDCIKMRPITNLSEWMEKKNEKLEKYP
jgi:hypothetical protein